MGEKGGFLYQTEAGNQACSEVTLGMHLMNGNPKVNASINVKPEGGDPGHMWGI